MWTSAENIVKMRNEIGLEISFLFYEFLMLYLHLKLSNTQQLKKKSSSSQFIRDSRMPGSKQYCV